MKKGTIWTRFALMTLALLMLVGTVGCNKTPRKDEYVGKQFDFDAASDPFAASQMDFSLELLQRSVSAAKEGESTLISPLSVSMALAMTACGASGETRAQMEAMLARGITFDELLEGLGAIRQKTYENKWATVRVANSLWTRKDAITLKEAYLAQNADYFGSVVYDRPFNNKTLKEINDWVSDRTDGMIPQTLEEIDPATVMYLINTLYFEAEWSEQYSRVGDGTFKTADGQVRNVKTLTSTESVYYDDGLAKGFSKYYAGGYSFVAMLPNEGISIEEYVAGLTSENLLGMLQKQGESGYDAKATIPKLDMAYSDEGRMLDILIAMGMVDACDAAKADFSAMGTTQDGVLYLDSVVHKTALELDENGTRAAAVTVGGMNNGGGMPLETVTLVFDRPFVFMIVDYTTKIPLFMGVVMDVK